MLCMRAAPKRDVVAIETVRRPGDREQGGSEGGVLLEAENLSQGKDVQSIGGSLGV